MVVGKNNLKNWRGNTYDIIRQQSLFGIQELYEMEPPQRYESITSAIELGINILH